MSPSEEANLLIFKTQKLQDIIVVNRTDLLTFPLIEQKCIAACGNLKSALPDQTTYSDTLFTEGKLKVYNDRSDSSVYNTYVTYVDSLLSSIRL